MLTKTKLIENDTTKERFILVAIETDTGYLSAESSLEELAELVKTADAEVCGMLIQNREHPHPATYLGKGKLLELKEYVNNMDATGIVCDDELSPSQLKHLNNELQVKVLDRTMLILDIFASRAKSIEGKIQVELAQLKYRLSRLSGIGTSLSRLGGGIGTRGPGEKKLETDRRHIKNAITELSRELESVKTHRALLREGRMRKNSIVVSLVGYTNTGKSTILNYFTNANVLSENKLFATLDTTTRNVTLPGGTEILLTDTVGFIQKLPHHLVQAFQSTLEELTYADILIHVVDSSSSMKDTHIDVVYKTLEVLSDKNYTVITCLNKIDKIDIQCPMPKDVKAVATVYTSAKTGKGMETLLSKIEEVIRTLKKIYKVFIPYTDAAMISFIHGRCEITQEEHRDDGYYFECYMEQETKNRLFKYIID